ncbi:MAG: DUF262 domain-containing protein [bacterium]|nr:DUF262 domain-containing protein [bacterium]
MENHKYKDIEEEKDEIEEELQEPYNPKDIDIVVEQKSIYSILKRIKYGKIVLDKYFEQEGVLWSDTIMSRFIESILLRIPLPIFYFDVANDECWLVVDGLQRLYTLKRFMLDCDDSGTKSQDRLPLKLVNLEFLKQYTGFTFDKLPSPMQRRLKETSILIYLIKPGTPKEIKYSMYYRINTGGSNLSPQEIRHVLNQAGPAPDYLKTIVQSGTFQETVNISPRSMQDRELVLRHIAFRLHSYDTYKPSMKGFLNEGMEELNSLPGERLNKLKYEFLDSLKIAEDIFGQHVFSKSLITPTMRKNTLNRGLFEVITVLLAEIPVEKRKLLIDRRKEFLTEFESLIREAEFNRCITSATTSTSQVNYRFKKVKALVSRYI